MTARCEILSTSLPDLQLIHRTPAGDSRGYLERMFCENELAGLIAGKRIVQINHTYTANQGTVRGMHYQNPPHAEMKIVSCLHGEVFDVAVDLRRDSATFLRWHAEVLSDANHRTLVIPEGFAHGFQTLTEHCQMLYLHTAAYNQPAEAGLNPRDPRLAIAWPMPLADVSPRDSSQPFMEDSYPGVVV